MLNFLKKIRSMIGSGPERYWRSAKRNVRFVLRGEKMANEIEITGKFFGCGANGLGKRSWVAVDKDGKKEDRIFLNYWGLLPAEIQKFKTSEKVKP